MTLDANASLHANLLSYARSIQNGEALFYGRRTGEALVEDGELREQALKPALVDEISVRGQIGNYIADANSKEFNLEQANLQTIDRAKLPVGADGLVIKFTVQFLPQALEPHACDDPQVAQNLTGLARRYAEVGGFHFLARRYLWNLLNGRWLWRNFLITEDKRIHLVTAGQGRRREVALTATPEHLDRQRYPGDAALGEIPGFEAMAEAIGGALAGERQPLTLEVIGEGSLPELSEIFPSEEYLAGEKANEIQRRRGNPNHPGKVLSSIEVTDAEGQRLRQPTFHPQKVGNAIRCIDEWHGDVARYGAVAADPYAALTTRAVALRKPREGSFYDYLTVKSRREELIKALEAEDLAAMGPVHFVMANLIRGGVFGGKE